MKKIIISILSLTVINLTFGQITTPVNTGTTRSGEFPLANSSTRGGDFDGDGVDDVNDLDDDNDGILDATEMYSSHNGGDTDNDGNLDGYDRDSDNDGIADIVEARGIDINGDGEVDGFVDLNSDGWDDGISANPLPGVDPDGDPNWSGVDLDSDNDGITDVIEAGGSDPDNNGQIGTGTSLTILDSDFDGFSDLVDTDNGGIALSVPNTDGLGRPDYADLDSDNDGIVDNIEAQTTASYLTPIPSGNDSDTDGVMDTYDNIIGFGGMGILPINTDGTDRPDYMDTNSDNDADSDALEGWDTDNNGTANVVPSGFDNDADGLDNAFDVNDIVWYPNNLQSPTSFPNMDFISTSERDWREAGFLDTDNDNIADSFDIDDDNDGLPDSVELATAVNAGDTDLDGVADNLDLDSDNDGIRDVIEAGGIDPDNDGIIGTGPITDTDGDGWSNITDSDNGGTALPNPDTDGDGKKNFQDVDSDGDTVLDSIENDPFATGNGPVDTDGDGIPNYIDTNDDEDYLITTNEADEDGNGTLDNCDGDAIPDYLDPDPCGLFIPNGFSPDGDGINDNFVINGLMLYPGTKLSILNRWGNRVYYQANYNNTWDGTGNEGVTIGGNLLPIGTYFYVLDLNNGEEPLSGYVYINR